MPFDVRHPEIVQIVKHALEEDIGAGDVTSDACVPAWKKAHGRFVARAPIVAAGLELLPLIYAGRRRGGRAASA